MNSPPETPRRSAPLRDAELTDRLPDHAVRSHDGALVGSSGRSLAPYGAHCLIRALPATTPPPLEWLVP